MRYQAALRPDCSTNTADKSKFKGYITYKFIINLIFNAIRDHMIIECPNCNKNFNLDEKLIPKNGRSLKCGNCDHIWHYKNILSSKKEVFKSNKNENNELNLDIPKFDEKEIDEKNIKIDKDDKNLLENEIKHGKIENKIEKNTNQKKLKIKMVFIYIIIIIISFSSLLLLIDTFKSNLTNIFPGINPLIDSFYNTLLDLNLFFKDLIN